MALRSAQDHLEARSSWSASTAPSSLRSHRPEHSRRAHREAHAAARSAQRRWLALGAVCLLAPLAAALAVVEAVH
jgi:uncharacterized membrane protein YccC